MTNATTQSTTIKHGELNLRSVTGRKAVAGDYVVFKNSHNGTPKGEPFEVESDGHTYISHTQEFTINGWGGSMQYDLYEVAPAIKVGDRVKILALSKFGKDYIGKFGIVEKTEHYGYISTRPEGDEYYPDGIYTADQLELQSELQTEEETTMARMFKVGDKVRVHAAANGRYGDLFDGAEGIIEDIDSDYEEMYRVSSEEADDYDRFEAKDIELIVDAPVEFKVGDMVEVLDASKGTFSDQRDGAIGTVSDISTFGFRVSIDGDFDRFPAEALRKVEDKPVKAATVPTFKEGDKVRMISTKPSYGMGEIKTGDIGTVRRVSDRVITVDFPKQSYWNGVASEFELDEDMNFEEGDLIRITNKDAIEGAYDVTNGKTYEIIDVDEDGDIEILDDDNDELVILRREFVGIEKVEAEDEFEQFQPGDKVVLVSGGGAFPLTGFNDGSEYEVRNNDFSHSEGRLIQLHTGDTYATGYAYPSQLKKVETTPTPKSPKFSIGDKAILTSDDGAATCGFYIGDEVTITGVSPGMNDYEITRGAAQGYASNRHLSAVVLPALKVAKVGDFIEIDFDFVGGDFSYVDLTKGKAYKVVPSKYRSDKLSLVDDANDTRTAHIEQGAYTVVDAPTRKLQVGDIVRVGASSSVNPTGSIGEITEFSGGGSARVNAGYGERGNYTSVGSLELIVAKENREDTK
jgi:hypothetical protein